MKTRPVFGSSMLVMNLGCPPQFAHGDAVGFWRSGFSNANSPADDITQRTMIGSQEMLGWAT
jgi:hypothetical protein